MRQKVRQWLKERINGNDAVSLPEITDEAIEYFQQDEQLIKELLEESLRPLVYDLGMKVLKENRREDVIELGDEVVTHTEFKKRSKGLASRFSTWMEYDGSEHRNLVKMTREHLLKATQVRRKRASTELHNAEFLQRLANGLVEGQTVEDRYSYSEIEAIYSGETPQERKAS